MVGLLSTGAGLLAKGVSALFSGKNKQDRQAAKAERKAAKQQLQTAKTQAKTVQTQIQAASLQGETTMDTIKLYIQKYWWVAVALVAVIFLWPVLFGKKKKVGGSYRRRSVSTPVKRSRPKGRVRGSTKNMSKADRKAWARKMLLARRRKAKNK